MDKNRTAENGKTFFITVCSLAVPVALQSMLQASFSIVDQIMIGQLGSASVAGVGLAGKFTSVFSVIVSSISAVAGIMIAQYIGQRNRRELYRSFYINLMLSCILAVIFTAGCALFPDRILRLYSTDPDIIQASSGYLRILSGTFLPSAGAALSAVLFRCMEKARLPLYASIASALLNTVLNYLLIFGRSGFPKMGTRGAAAATLIAQITNLLIMLCMLYIHILRPAGKEHMTTPVSESAAGMPAFHWRQYAAMLFPVLFCEFMWSLGENVYAAIYGHMGTDAAAAMTLINPVQSLVIGALCGLSQAAGVIIGKLLGGGEYGRSYSAAEKLIFYGFSGSAVLSLLVIAFRGIYVDIYHVEETVKNMTQQILLAYAVIVPFKIQNMIIGGGILRSGGKTKYVMIIDLIGTWVFGVPLGLISAFVFHLSIPYVYFILSLEECIRFAISLRILRQKKWMSRIS